MSAAAGFAAGFAAATVVLAAVLAAVLIAAERRPRNILTCSAFEVLVARKSFHKPRAGPSIPIVGS